MKLSSRIAEIARFTNAKTGRAVDAVVIDDIIKAPKNTLTVTGRPARFIMFGDVFLTPDVDTTAQDDTMRYVYIEWTNKEFHNEIWLWTYYEEERHISAPDDLTMDKLDAGRIRRQHYERHFDRATGKTWRKMFWITQ